MSSQAAAKEGCKDVDWVGPGEGPRIRKIRTDLGHDSLVW